MFLRLMVLCFAIVLVSARKPLPDRTDNNFQNECLKASNNYRSKHHAPAFRIDTKAVTYAKSRCNLISQYEGLSHGHAGLKGYGENLYWGGSTSKTPGGCTAAINSWYNEWKKYNYNKPGFSSATGHFTQLVWKSSTGVGCARCFGKGSKFYETYVVCNYSPPGNVGNQFPKNVLRP